MTGGSGATRSARLRRPRGRRGVLRLTAVAVPSVLAAGLVLSATASPAAADEARDAQYWLSSYGIEDAWKTTRGEGVRVAVIDSGVADGPDAFDEAVVGGHDASGVGSANGRTPVGPTPGSDHGSWVASLLAARGTGDDGEDGVIGVAPEAEILSVSLGFSDSGSPIDFSDQIVDAVTWAVDNNADVINLSLTTNTKSWPRSWDTAFQYAADHDVVVVAAAGNRGAGTDVVGAPATIPGVLSVAGVDRGGEASEDSSSQGITIGVAAPSEELVGVSPDGTVVRWEGTSGAAPIVAGVAALVRSAHPELDAANVINRITHTARPGPDQGADEQSPIYGFGLIDADRAVNADVPRVTANPMGSLAEWVTTYRPAAGEAGDGADTGDTVPETVPPLAAEEESPSAWFSQDAVTYLVIPLVVLSGTATLVVLGAIGAIRHFRRVSEEE
ncbi:MAG: S8 family serine peptidase [Mycetocola sp.]